MLAERLEQLAESTADPTGRSTVDDAPRPRGPMRPEQLVSVRRRQDRRLAGHRFRTVDTLFLLVTSGFLLHRLLDRPVLDVPIGALLPVIAGLWSTWWLLRSLRLYRFGRSERIVAHFGGVGGAVGIGVGVASLLVWVLPTEPASPADVVELMLICGGGLLILHVLWWTLVARWRSLGLLTPNLVIVGATNDAEDLISIAIERRDMNILGIFDDRAERSPLALQGVPVLGTTEAMLRHRVLPYVDLIVVAIDPAATVRVRQIMDRLSVLPNTITLLFDDSIGEPPRGGDRSAGRRTARPAAPGHRRRAPGLCEARAGSRARRAGTDRERCRS